MIRHTLNILGAYILEHRKTFIGGVVLGFLFFFIAVKVLPDYLASKPQVEIIGEVGNFTLQNLPLDIQKKLSYGLTMVGDDGTATIAAAISWESTDSGKTYIFKLNDNLYWHDGKKLTAYDVNYQLQDVNIVPRDESTVEFRLNGSYSPLPTILSQPLFKNGLIGLGEYKIQSIKFSGRFIESLNLYKQGKILVYKFYSTEKQVITALRLGEVKSVENLLDISETRDLVTVGKIDYSKQAVIILNEKNSYLGDKSFRQALIYGLPATFSGGLVSNGPISPNSWGYSQNLKKYIKDPGIARKIISKTAASESAKIVLSTTNNLKEVAGQIKESWEKAGVLTEIDLNDSLPKEYEALLTYINLPSDPDQYSLWHSTALFNNFGYKSPKVDRLLEEGRQILDPASRKQKYMDFQKAITEDVPVAFLYFPKVYTVTRK